jgi:hypothetical protein
MLAALLLGVAGEPGSESVEIAPGVFARGRSLGDDRAAVEEVWIRPARRAGEPSPDLGPLLEAAFDWCSGNKPNGVRRSETGFVSYSGCAIRVESGPYRLSRTAVLRQLRERAPVEIDLGGAAILHTPEQPRSVRVADVPSLACDPGHQGDYYEVSDPESFDDFLHADPEGAVPISRIEPNRERTPGCPEGGSVCKYGGNAARVITAKPHGLTDGSPLGIGDVAVFSVPGTPYDHQRLLVKEVVGPTAFIVTPFFEAVAASGGSVRETATTIWCNGHRWRAGKPMIALKGPGDVRNSRVSLRGGSFAVDVMLYRTAAVLIDGDSGQDRQGGAEWVSVDTTHSGTSDLRGQIVVDMGTPDGEGICQHVDVRVQSDHWGPSWGPAVWNRSCSFAEIEIHQGHGGGLWVGIDRHNFPNPAGVAVKGAVLGCKDGPCLWVRSGTLQFGPGFAAIGSQFGPLHSPPGPYMGLVAILGGPRDSALVNVTAHGMSWSAGQESDLDCYVLLGDHLLFVQDGGALLGGNRPVGSGRDTLFCSAPGTQVDDFVLEHTRNLTWGGNPRFAEVESRGHRSKPERWIWNP